MNLNFDGMRVGDRVANDEYEKESLADFALWKSRVADDGAELHLCLRHLRLIEFAYCPSSSNAVAG